MRRPLVVVALLLVAFVAADQWARGQVQTALEDAVADRLAAASADVQLRGLLVLPQLLGGELRTADVTVRDAVVGDPAVRLAEVDATLEGLEVPFPPPAELDRVTVRDGQVRIVLLPREVGRLLAVTRPEWQVAMTDDGIRATGEVRGVEVAVVADVAVVGRELRFSARDVEVGGLGLEAANAVAAAFDTRVALPDLPEGLVIETAEAGADGLVLRGRVSGALALR